MGEDSCKNMLVEDKAVPETNGVHNFQQNSYTSSTMSTCSEADSESVSCARSDDDDQDLQYGPGIVSKLRTKFLSISLKQSRGTMRRSCSLEDILEPKPATSDKFHPNKSSCENSTFANHNPSWSGIKRAKSMDTLLLSSEANLADICGPSEFSKVVNNAIERDNGALNFKNSHEPKVIRRKDGPLNRPTMTICDEELPKPDTVKTYKRMFEPAESKKTVNSNVRRKPPVLRAKSGSSLSSKTNSVSSSKKIPISVSSIIPRTTKPKFCAKSVISNDVSLATKAAIPKSESMENSDTINVDKNLTQVNNFKKDQVQNQSSIKNNVVKTEIAQLKSEDPKRLLRTPKYGGIPALSRIKPDVPPNRPILQKGIVRSIARRNDLHIKSNTTQKDPPTKADDEILPSGITTANKLKWEQQSPGEKDLVKTKSNTEDPKPDQNGEVDLKTSTLPSTNTVLNGLTKPLNAEFTKSEIPSGQIVSPVKIRPLVHDDIPKSESKKSSVGCVTGSVNTMVFDFRGRDVVSHLTIQPTPFGCTAAHGRRCSDGKESRWNGFTNGLDDETDEEEFTDYNEPPPCGLVFEGENIRIGKGAMLATRNKDLKIQFDEDVENNTFVYPSETSLLDFMPSPPTPSPQSPTSTSCEQPCPESPNTAKIPNESPLPAKLRANTPIGSSTTGGLMSYTPSVLRTVDNFQPGLFRLQDDKKKVQPIKNGEVNGLLSDDENSNSQDKEENKAGTDEDDAEMLKPADPEFISSWSLSTNTSDLLF